MHLHLIGSKEEIGAFLEEKKSSRGCMGKKGFDVGLKNQEGKRKMVFLLKSSKGYCVLIIREGYEF